MNDVLSPYARRALLQEKKELESQLKFGKDGNLEYGKVKNPSLLKKRIKQIEGLLEKGSPQAVSGAEKDRIAARVKELERKIAGIMDKYGCSRDGLNKSENGHQVLKYESEAGPLIREVRNLKRTLEPDDETSGNLEYLRKGGAESRRGKPANIIVH